MGQRIKCKTIFDITVTGVKSHYKTTLIPFVDQSGNHVSDLASWNKSRNKQRNWETLNQLISLRSLPYNISTPLKQDNMWSFEFEVDNLEEITAGQDPVGALKQDCAGVPMILGLDEIGIDTSLLITDSDNANIWFSLDTHK